MMHPCWCRTSSWPLRRYQVFLVGLKADLCDATARSDIQRRAKRYAASIKAEYWETSSVTGDHIADLFDRIATVAFVNRALRLIAANEQPAPESDTIRLPAPASAEPTLGPKKGCRC